MVGAVSRFLYRIAPNATVHMQADWNGVRLREPWAGVGGGIASAQVSRQYLITRRTMLTFFAATLKNVMHWSLWPGCLLGSEGVVRCSCTSVTVLHLGSLT
jgi:hypothetical protein